MSAMHRHDRVVGSPHMRSSADLRALTERRFASDLGVGKLLNSWGSGKLGTGSPCVLEIWFNSSDGPFFTEVSS